MDLGLLVMTFVRLTFFAPKIPQMFVNEVSEPCLQESGKRTFSGFSKCQLQQETQPLEPSMTQRTGTQCWWETGEG